MSKKEYGLGLTKEDYGCSKLCEEWCKQRPKKKEKEKKKAF